MWKLNKDRLKIGIFITVTLTMIVTTLVYNHVKGNDEVSKYNHPPTIKQYPVYVKSSLDPEFRVSVRMALILANKLVFDVWGRHDVFRPMSRYSAIDLITRYPNIIHFKPAFKSEKIQGGRCEDTFITMKTNYSLMEFQKFSPNFVYTVTVCDNVIKKLQSEGLKNNEERKRIDLVGLHTYFAHELLHAMFPFHIKNGCAIMCRKISSSVLSDVEKRILREKILPKVTFLP